MDKQLVIDAVTRDKIVPYTPMAHFTTMVSHQMMNDCGAKFPDAHSDPVKMAKLGSMAFEQYGFASVKVPFDVCIEAEALGADINYGTFDIVPQVTNGNVRYAEDLVMPSNLANAGRIPVQLEAVRIMKKQYPEVAVVGTVMGPVAIMSLMFGFAKIMGWMVEEDENWDIGMQFCTDLGKKYIKLLEEAGADAVVLGEAAASASIFGRQSYEDYIMQYHSQLHTDMKVPLIAHICGWLDPYLPILPQCNFDGIGFDQKTKMSYANEMLGKKVKKVGNVAPIDVVWKGTPEMIEKAVYDCLDEGTDLLTLGCCLPLQTEGKQLKVFAAAYKKYMHEKMGIDIQI